MNRKVSLRIRYDRRSGLVGLLALALLVAALLGHLAWNQGKVAASGPQAPLASSAGMRGYYLTKTLHSGADADGTDGNGAGVCAEGYHFASLWEIVDPSNLKYDTARGKTKADSGQGPLTGAFGWVRTGYSSNNGATAGQANCDTWSGTSGNGTRARLPSDWTAGGQDIHVWEVGTTSCGASTYVWCVADDVSFSIYLPLVLR